MNIPLSEQLHSEGLISDQSLGTIKKNEESRLFSIHWELRSVLYLGVLLLTGGLAVLVYKNIDTIGHQVILCFIAVLCACCFIYCERTKRPFSPAKTPAPNAYFDYVLLLGCLTFTIFITYLQVQYTAFGTAYGLAAFIPMAVLFFSAYYFDHLGILSMAITNLAAWAGIAVTPLTILKSDQFADPRLIFTGLALGVLLVVAALASERRKIKAHFCFTYLNFGMNILFISCLAGMFYFESLYLIWLVPLAAMTYYFFRRAVAMLSFYLTMMLAIYAYVGITYILIRLTGAYLAEAYGIALLYFIGTAIGMILFLIHMNKKLKHNDSL